MNGEDIKRLHPVRPIVPFPSGFENMSSEEQRAFLQRESLSLQRNENSYSQLKGELEDDLKTVGIEIDLPMEFENFDQTRKIDTLTDAKNFIGKIKKDGKLDVLVNILKSRFNGKFVVQRSQNSYRYLQSLVNESDGSEGVATGGLIAMTSDIDEHTPAGRRLQGALAMEGNDQAMEMENKNLIKTLENNGFTFSIDMESRGIRMDPERQNHIIIGELADRSAVNVFLKSALSEGVVKEDMGEILGSKKIQRENILDQKPMAPKVESIEELLNPEHKEPLKGEDPLYRENNAITDLSPQPEPISQEAPAEPTVSSPENVGQLILNGYDADKSEDLERYNKDVEVSYENLKNLCSNNFSIDLSYNEEHFEKFQNKNPFELPTALNKIKEALGNFSGKNFKDKFSYIRLGYPEYQEDSRVSIDDDTLYIDLSSSKEEIIEFLNDLNLSDKHIEVDLELYDPSKSTDEYDLKSEIDGAIQSLEDGDLDILKNSKFKISAQGEEVMFPVYLEDSNTLKVGFLNTADDILDVIKNTVLPSLKDKSLSKVNNPANPVEQPEEISNLGNGEVDPSKLSGLLPKEVESGEVVGVVGNEGEIIKKERVVEELKKIRGELANMEVKGHKFNAQTGESTDLLKNRYNAKKEELLKHIENEIRKEKEYGPLTQEQEREVKSKFGDELYKVLKSENDLYKTALKETRGETWKGKAKESFRDLLGTKGMKWYMGLSRIQRFALNTALFSVIGAGVAFAAPTGTAATAIGVGTYRVARGVGAFAGSGLGMWGSNKILKPEQLNEWKTQEEQKIKDSEDSIEVKSERIKELEEEFNRRLRNLNIKKIGLTALAGGIGGAVSGGILDYAYGGSGGSGVAESLGRRGNVGERLGGKGPGVAPIEDTRVPEPTKPDVPEGVVKEATNLDKVVGQPGTEVAAKLFSYPGAVIQTPLQGKGDSVWRLTKYVLENNERFSNLAHSGQKDNVISWYTNKIINDPSLINSVKDPNFGVKLEVDKPVDFSKVFGDEAEFEKVLSRAEKLSPELIKQIEEKTQALESVYKFNPTKTLTNEEILKVEDMPKASVGVEIEDIKKPEISDIGKSDVPEPIGKLGRYLTESEKAEFMGPALDRIEKIEGNLSELKKLGIEEGRLKGIEEQALEFKKRIKYLGDNYTGPDGKVDAVKDVLGTSENIEKLEKEIENLVKEEIERHRGLAPLPKVPDLGAGYAMGAGAVIGGGLLNKMAGANGTDFVKREEVEDEIRRAKERLEEIEREKNQKVVQMPVRNGALIRSPGMDMDRASRTPDAIDVKVEEAFINTINSVYGEAGILGLGKKKNGVLSKGWALMKGLSAKEVIKFFTNDSDQTKLPSNVLDSLKKDKNHGNFGIELLKLIEIAGSMRRPENSVLNANSNKLDLNLEPRSETENVESYIKRIARFVTEMESERNRTQSSIKMAA